jgi:ABC-type sugar transport system ATPase subunit
VFEICDRIAVMRDAEMIGTRETKATSRRELIRMMVGREVEDEFPKVPAELGETVLEVSGLRRGKKVRGVNFTLRAGEVLALAGLVGAGRTETARLVAGVDKMDDGCIYMHGKGITFSSPRAAIRAGVCLLPEDRKGQGLILGQSCRDNYALPNLDAFSRFAFVKSRQIARAFARLIEKLNIRLPHQEQAAKNLSGGNQQKVVLAKWLQRESKVLIFDEPTRGIDVGSKAEIYQIINGLAAEGKAIILISSELPEVLGMADRIVVMHEGQVKGEIANPRSATQEDVLQMAIGA